MKWERVKDKSSLIFVRLFIKVSEFESLDKDFVPRMIQKNSSLFEVSEILSPKSFLPLTSNYRGYGNFLTLFTHRISAVSVVEVNDPGEQIF